MIINLLDLEPIYLIIYTFLYLKARNKSLQKLLKNVTEQILINPNKNMKSIALNNGHSY